MQITSAKIHKYDIYILYNLHNIKVIKAISVFEQSYIAILNYCTN